MSSKKFELMPSAEGIFALAKEKECKVSSVTIAEVLEVPHKNILRSIDKMFEENSGWSESFLTAQFCAVKYKSSRGRLERSFDMTRDGFMAVVKSINTKKANEIMEKYIKAFNKMEDILRSVYESRLSFPQMTQAIKDNFSEEEIKEKFIYSRECNLIYMIVFGHNAKWLKEHYNVGKEQNILSLVDDKNKVEACVYLQIRNAVLLDLGILDYQQRKIKLEELYSKYITRMIAE